MKPEDKRYILENMDKKSVKEISQKLNIKEKKIRKFLEKEKDRKAKPDSAAEAGAEAKKWIIFVSAALIIILGFAAYVNSLNGEFLWDDQFLVRDNVYIRNWSNVSKFFCEDIGTGSALKSDFYRPLQMITYMIDYSLWKLDVRGYHFTNILLHILTALCVYWLINILYGDRILSLFTGALFVVHPIHTEAVAYISGRTDSMVMVFAILSFIFYIRYLGSSRISAYLLMLLSYVSAVLSRETGLILPVLLLLYHYIFKKRLRIKQFIPILVVAFAYILLRFTALRHLMLRSPSYTTLFQRMPGFFAAVTNYIKLMLFPFNLHMEYGDKLFNFADPAALSGAAILFSLLVYAFRKRVNNKLASFSIFWFFIALLPVSNLYPINAYMAEHWLYLPSIGFFLVLTQGLSLLYRAKNFRVFVIAFIIGLSAFYSYLTIKQNDYWREPVAFYERTLKYAPDSSKAYNNLGNIYKVAGKREEAAALYEKSLGADPNNAMTYNNLGVMYYELGRIEEAVASYKRAIELQPSRTEAYYNLGRVYKDTGRNEEAVAFYEKAIEADPTHAEAYNDLGITYFTVGNKEEAIASFKRAIEINPNHAMAYNNLGNVYNAMGKRDEAIAFYKNAIEVNPNYVEAYYNLAVAYYDEGKYSLAVSHCDRALGLGYGVNPEFLRLLEPHRTK